MMSTNSGHCNTFTTNIELPKIGELLKNYKLDHQVVNFEPRGLQNGRNSCYMNAILQTLLSCPPFYNLMNCISQNIHNSATKIAIMQHFPIIDSMVEFINEFKQISHKSRRIKTKKLGKEIVHGEPFMPTSMQSVIEGNSQFTVGRQEDAEEFLTYLLNGLNDEMIELINLAESNNMLMSNGDIVYEVRCSDDGDSEWQQKQSKSNLSASHTPLCEIFRGQIRWQLKSSNSGIIINDILQPFFTIHLNIQKSASVQEALEKFFQRDSLEASSTTSHKTLEDLPYVLLLHLEYFDFEHNGCKKILKATKFSISIQLKKKLISMESPLRSKVVLFKLFAVVYHEGEEATTGHYTADVFHIASNRWIRYNDTKVCTVSQNDVLKPILPRVPYLLFYRKCN